MKPTETKADGAGSCVIRSTDTMEPILREALARSRDGFLLMDCGSDYSRPVVAFANRALSEAVGLPIERCLGSSLELVLADFLAADALAELAECLKAGRAFWRTLRRGNHSERERTYIVGIRPVQSEDSPTICCWIGDVRDVTLEFARESELRELHERTAFALDAIRVGIWDWRVDTGQAFWSHQAREILGAAPDLEPSYSGFLQNVIGDDRARVASAVQANLDTDVGYDITFAYDRQGEPRRMRARGAAMRDASGRAVRMLGTLQDVELEAQVQDALRTTEMRFRHLAANIPGAIFQYVWHADGSDGIEYMSPGCEKIWEWSAEDLRGNPARLWAAVLPEDFPGMRQSVIDSARTLEPWVWEWRIRTPSGRLKWVQGRGTPVRMPDGGTLWNSLVLDITHQVHTQRALDESQERLHRAQKLDALGKLTGGLAHDFNNLLSIINGSLELLLAEPDSEVRAGLASDALAAAQRGAELTRSLMAFARQAKLDSARLDVRDVIESWLPVLRRALPQHVELHFNGPSEPLWVQADRSSLESALLNLVINARDAMPNGGAVVLSARGMHWPGDAEVAAGSVVEIAVADNGAGIAPEALAQVLEPFFTTKGPAEGSGLGLPMVHGFLRQSGGTLRVESQPGQGTTVRLIFPGASPQSNDVQPREPHTAELATLHYRILLVEDEPIGRKVLGGLLRKSGCEVAEAADAAQGIDVWHRQGPFDVLVTDVTMPGLMQGTDLALSLIEQAPTLGVVIVSGLALSEMIKQPALANRAVWLSKPYSRQQLLSAVQSAGNVNSVMPR